MPKYLEKIPGAVLVIALSAVVVFWVQYISFSTTLLAISLGFIVTNLFRLPPSFNSGIKWLETKSLAVAVALLGLQLNLVVLSQINLISIALITLSILLAFVATFVLVKFLRISSFESWLIACGQAICGSAAIMAAAKVIESSDSIVQSKQTAPIGLIIAVVNFLGLLGVFLTPWLVAQFFPSDGMAAGFLIGNTLQSMGHVVAAGFSVNEAVGQNAVLIKMCRILFLIPTLMTMVFWFSKKQSGLNEINQENHVTDNHSTDMGINWFKMIPLFIWGFLVLILLNNSGLIVAGVKEILIQLGDFLFILAMVAIGLNARLRDIWQQGGQLILLGSVVFVLQILFTWVALMLI